MHRIEDIDSADELLKSLSQYILVSTTVSLFVSLNVHDWALVFMPAFEDVVDASNKENATEHSRCPIPIRKSGWSEQSLLRLGGKISTHMFCVVTGCVSGHR